MRCWCIFIVICLWKNLENYFHMSAAYDGNFFPQIIRRSGPKNHSKSWSSLSSNVYVNTFFVTLFIIAFIAYAWCLWLSNYCRPTATHDGCKRTKLVWRINNLWRRGDGRAIQKYFCGGRVDMGLKRAGKGLQRLQLGLETLQLISLISRPSCPQEAADLGFIPLCGVIN